MPGVPGANGLLQKAADRFVDVTNACFSVGIYLRQTVYPPELSRYLDEDTIVHPNSLYRTADAYLSGRTIWRFKILCSASVPNVPVHDRFRLYPFGQNAACRRNAEAVGSECQRDRRVFGIFQCILFFTLIQKILFRESFQICITRIMREVLV